MPCQVMPLRRRGVSNQILPLYRVVQRKRTVLLGTSLTQPAVAGCSRAETFSQLSAISFAQPCRFPFPQQGVNGQSVIDSRPKQQSCEGKRMRPSRTALSGEIPDVDRIDLSGTNTWPSWTAASPLSSHKFDKTCKFLNIIL